MAVNAAAPTTVVQRSRRLRVALAATGMSAALMSCADLDEAMNGPSRESVSVPLMVPSDAPPPPASLLGLAGPPRPRPRTPTVATAAATAPNLRAPRTAEEQIQPEVAAVPVAAAPPPPPTASPDRLLGLTEASLEIWLGPPQQRLNAAPARVWRYTENQCHLDAFLYLDMQTKEFHVLHYEVATNDGSDQRKDDCVRQILVRNGGPLPHPGPVQAQNRPN